MSFNPLNHPILLSHPERLVAPYNWQEHIPFAMLLVDLLRPAMIVELGTHTGNSYCALCQAVKELSLGTRCYAVDTWSGDPQAGVYGAEVLAELRAHHDPRYAGFSRLVQSMFDDALPHFPDGSIDLLHIDGLHTYESVLHDYEAWLPKLSSRAIVLFHDVNVHERDFGVRRVWDQVRQGRPHLTFLHGHGLGVLAVGEVESDELRWLLEGDEQRGDQVRSYFALLGHRLTARAEADGYRESADTLARDVAYRDEVIERQTAQAIARDEQVGQFRGQLEAAVARVGELEAELSNLRAEHQQAAQTWHQQDLALRAAAEGWRSQLAATEQARSALQTRLALAESTLDALLRSRPVRLARGLRRLLGQQVAIQEQPIISFLDAPAQNSELGGLLTVNGWAVSRAGAIRKVEVFLDGVLVGEAHYGLPRLDSVAYFKSDAFVNCGFGGQFALEAATPGTEPKTVLVRVSDEAGNQLDHARTVIPGEDAYSVWLKNHSPSPEQLARQRDQARALAARPLVSVVVPVYNPPVAVLRAAIDSILAQTYDHWELVAVNGSPAAEGVRSLLDEYAARDQRVRVTHLEQNLGISGNTNAALELARGELVAFLDHDDALTPDALFENIALINRAPQTDVIYSDQDKIDEGGRCFFPFFKPDWSPEYLRGVMYIGHLLVVRRALALQVGGFDSDYDGIQDYEFMLRLAEATQAIAHIPRVLYHWRTVSGSIAASTGAKGKIEQLQQKAVNAHLRRLGLAAEAEAREGTHRVRMKPLPQTAGPRVSIIIPTKDAPDHIERCLSSIFDRSSYTNFEVVVVDNETSDARALAAMRRDGVKRVLLPSPFNYSRANNLGVEYAEGELLLFLNNDTEVVEPDWLQHMIYYAQQPDVGGVGALLLYPNRTVQHAGVVLGFRGTADHLMRGFPQDSDGYAGSLACAREVSAVTAACMMMRRADFDRLGGFDEYFAVQYQDVDLCLKILRDGKRIIYTPRATLIHHESATRKTTYDHGDRALLLDLWQAEIERGDPYYNPNFDVRMQNYALKLN
jgi:O-antigen biosynthesis protein